MHTTTQQTVFIIFAGVLFLVDILFQDFQFVFDPDPNVRRMDVYISYVCAYIHYKMCVYVL